MLTKRLFFFCLGALLSIIIISFFGEKNRFKETLVSYVKYFDIDEEIIKKPPSPNLWDDHKASDELPLEYEKLDLVLFKLFKEQISDSMISQQLNIPINIINEIKGI